MGASSPGSRVALAETARSQPVSGELVVPNIRLKEPIGEGGMGRVWLAEHLGLKADVVVKFMAEDLAGDADAAARFSREAASAAQVRSPHVVQMLDYGVTETGVPFIVMEFLEGEDLSVRVERERLSRPDAGEVVIQLGRALGKAHERGIVHRDVKPSNVFLCDVGDGRVFVKLLDFGVAKANAGHLLGGMTTDTGALMGSPFYMSPEQVIGSKELDFRADLWALGVLGFELATGRRPFEAETVGALALKIHHEPLPHPSDVDTALPRPVDDWFARACARDPKERFESAKEQAEAFAVALLGADAPRISGSLRAAPALSSSLLETGSAVVLSNRPPRKRVAVLAIAGVIIATVIVTIGVMRAQERTPAASHIAPLAVSAPPVQPAPAAVPHPVTSAMQRESPSVELAPKPEAKAKPGVRPPGRKAVAPLIPARPAASASASPAASATNDIF
jgi:serine/threonine-protein kinase